MTEKEMPEKLYVLTKKDGDYIGFEKFDPFMPFDTEYIRADRHPLETPQKVEDIRMPDRGLYGVVVIMEAWDAPNEVTLRRSDYEMLTACREELQRLYMVAKKYHEMTED